MDHAQGGGGGGPAMGKKHRALRHMIGGDLTTGCEHLTRSSPKGGSCGDMWCKMVSSLRRRVQPDALSRLGHMTCGERRPFMSESYDPT
jgi:hypothetical protein